MHHFILPLLFSFFFNATATTEIYTLSLHDALPISQFIDGSRSEAMRPASALRSLASPGRTDRKSTRLNSSHTVISYAVFCLKKKKKIKKNNTRTRMRVKQSRCLSTHPYTCNTTWYQ